MEDFKHLEIDVETLPFENKEEFNIMVVKPSDIEAFDYNHPCYITKLINEDFHYIETADKQNFFEKVAINLKIKEFEPEDRNIISHIVYDKPGFVYEIMFLDVLSEKNKNKKNENQFGCLINFYGEKIYGNMIITKTNMSINSKQMLLDKLTKEDLFEMLDSRVNTKVVVYQDGEFREDVVRGDIDIYCKNLFEEDYYKSREIAFLKHNLNINYISSEYGNSEFPKLVPGKIESAVFFTMNNENARGCITLNEVKKIIKLSNTLETFEPKPEWLDDEFDSLGRKVVKNKYRILEYALQYIENKISNDN